VYIRDMENINTIEVIGRNSYKYDATHLSGNLYIVGKYIVLVEQNRYCRETIARATKANIEKALRRAETVGFCH